MHFTCRTGTQAGKTHVHITYIVRNEQKFLRRNNAEGKSDYVLDKIQLSSLFVAMLSPGNLIKPKDSLPPFTCIIHNLHFQLKTLLLAS